jgi:sarcosine oxidase
VTGREFDHVVVGLGGIGSAALYQLARRGARVLGIEQFAVGHDHGASEDHSRIIRRSYHTPGYVMLADAAFRAWSEVEIEAGETLVVRTGGLDLFPAGAAIPSGDYERSMRACGVPFEVIDGAEAMRRWPQWAGLDESVKVLYQSDTGIVAASRANAAHRRLAAEHGAVRMDRTGVAGLRDAGGEVDVLLQDGRSVRASSAVLAADAWTNDLLARLDVRLPLTVTQEQVVYLDPLDQRAFAPERFPVWIWMDDPSFYGFPAFGAPGPKAAQDVGGRTVTPSSRTFDPDTDALRRVTAFVERHLPGAARGVLRVKSCLYTLTPDRDFVLDRVPGHPGIVVALGAAHGFKFAALFGQILADLAGDGSTSVADLSPFAMDRPILTMDDPPTSYLI